ncbi:hypothetical protein A2U01_0035084 [Trifolium medium]|uniref:Uncharacterized protein n=1 Tax=Trifolium medium TaxID=97028 RepID=A0A392PR85_9FABA|nr:hypothetical protein [Trifolium medium]
MRLRRLPHQQYCGRNCGCGPEFKTLNGSIRRLPIPVDGGGSLHRTGHMVFVRVHRLVQQQVVNQQLIMETTIQLALIVLQRGIVFVGSFPRAKLIMILLRLILLERASPMDSPSLDLASDWF